MKKVCYFTHNKASLFQGNCLNRDSFDADFVDLTVTSPPYNVGIEYNSNDDEVAYEQYLAFSEGGFLTVFIGQNRKDGCL